MICAQTAPRLRLLLVDDHTVVREGLKRLMDPQGNQWAITEAGTCLQALECLRRETFDLFIAELSLPDMSGLNLIRRIQVSYPSFAVLVLTMYSEEQYSLSAFQAGASGCVATDGASEELVGAMRRVASGGVFVTVVPAVRLVQQRNRRRLMSDFSFLSNWELKILRRVVAGQRMVYIADALHLSIKTVSTHKTRILEKLQFGSTVTSNQCHLENQPDRADAVSTLGPA